MPTVGDMEPSSTSGRARRRKEQQIGVVRRRAALASALGFAAFLGLAAQHAVGSAKHSAARAATPSPAAAPIRYFDQQAGSVAFDDALAAGSAAPLPPPVAQTNVS